MFNRCSHKFGEIQADGYQYCKKCNKAVSVSCNHKWEEQKEFTQMIMRSGTTNEMIGTSMIMRCKICGEQKTFNSRISD